MAHKKKRGISFGSVLMILLTVATVGACIWFLPQFVGDLGQARQETGELLHVITGSASISEDEQQELIDGLQVNADKPIIAPDVSAPPEPSATETPEVRSLTIRAVGSIYSAKNIRQSGYIEATDNYTFKEIFDPVAPMLSSADLTLATLETTLAGKEAGYGDYNAPTQFLDAMKGAGINAVSLATERALEYGVEGLRATLMQAESKGVIAVGARHNAEDTMQPAVFQINGIQVAVLAYTYGLSKQSTDKVSKAEQKMVSVTEINTIRSQINTVRKDGANLVIVMMHWGTKDESKLSDAQKNLGSQIAAAGADIIIGTHPNVVQGVTTKTNDGRLTYIAYSLGSFLSDDRDIVNAASMILTIKVEMDPATRKIRFVEASYTPTWVERIKLEERYQYRVVRSGDEATQEAMDSSLKKHNENALRHVTRTVGENGVTKMVP